MSNQALMAIEEKEVGKGRYRVRLSNVGNPDFRQDSERELPGTGCGWVRVPNFRAASEVCRHYISFYDLGGGNWSGGVIEDSESGLIVARVSYNGRVWESKTGKYEEGAKEIAV